MTHQYVNFRPVGQDKDDHWPVLGSVAFVAAFNVTAWVSVLWAAGWL